MMADEPQTRDFRAAEDDGRGSDAQPRVLSRRRPPLTAEEAIHATRVRA
jgi:hypothetical protein